jgi:hypothetical protein
MHLLGLEPTLSCFNLFLAGEVGMGRGWWGEVLSELELICRI